MTAEQDLEVRIWKELANKIAWALGTTYNVPYSPVRSPARTIARQVARDAQVLWAASWADTEPRSPVSAPIGPPAPLVSIDGIEAGALASSLPSP